MKNMPIIRLDIEAMGEQLHSMIVLHGEEVAEAVQAGVLEAVEELDITALAREHAKPAIEKSVRIAIDNYFAWGKGSALIKGMVGNSVVGGPQ